LGAGGSFLPEPISTPVLDGRWEDGDYRSPSVRIYGREGAALKTMLEEMMSPSFAVIAGKRADPRKLVTKRPLNSQ